MKILIMGDLHLSTRSPEKRIDEYVSTQINKLYQIEKIYKQEGCDCAIQVGDFFDSPQAGNYIISLVLNFLAESSMNLHCIFGQHDIVGHSVSTFNRSPLHILCCARKVLLLNHIPKVYFKHMIYGASFGQEVPTPKYSEVFNILVVHDMIGNRPLFPDQELKSPARYLRQHLEYDLICCGDYHYRFSTFVVNKCICNPGAVLRKTTSEWDLAHQPAVFIFNTEKKEIKEVLLEVKPISEVFDLSEKMITKSDNVQILKFVNELKEKRSVTESWKDNLINVFDERKTSVSVRERLDSYIVENSNG